MSVLRTCFLLCSLAFSICSLAQLRVNCGPDSYACVSLWGVDTTAIGHTEMVSGGKEPYSYSWEANYNVGSTYFGASYFLNDSTLDQPLLVNAFHEPIHFKLTVTDADGQQASDSLVIRFSQFGYLQIELADSIKQGDSLTLNHTIGNGIGPLRFFWSPDYHLSNTKVEHPKAAPLVDTVYSVYAIDSVGCVSSESIHTVYVEKSSSIKDFQQKLKVKIFPNPINDGTLLSIDENSFKSLELRIISADGKEIIRKEFYGNSIYIGADIKQSGAYFYLLYHQQELLARGSFIR